MGSHSCPTSSTSAPPGEAAMSPPRCRHATAARPSPHPHATTSPWPTARSRHPPCTRRLLNTPLVGSQVRVGQPGRAARRPRAECQPRRVRLLGRRRLLLRVRSARRALRPPRRLLPRRARVRCYRLLPSSCRARVECYSWPGRLGPCAGWGAPLAQARSLGFARRASGCGVPTQLRLVQQRAWLRRSHWLPRMSLREYVRRCRAAAHEAAAQ